ncbi:MAG: pyridoxamine 5'-phosphate oxidase family protein [Clostridia bacterium]|nr:pyridoxamine 5'-phosphate oxidase family protein [Clostridia bacterium]
MKEHVFRQMRRIAQQTEDAACVTLLESEKRGVLALCGENGYPYAVPLNFVYQDGRLYFHSAQEGQKIDAVRACDKASFCVVNAGEREPDDWWYHVTSVIAFGRVRVLEDRAETEEKLRLLGEKYFPAGYDLERDLRKNADRAAIIEFTIEHMTGKRVREK